MTMVPSNTAAASAHMRSRRPGASTLLREMYEHEHTDAGLLGRPGRIEVAGAGLGHARIGFLTVDEVAHVQEYVGPLPPTRSGAASVRYHRCTRRSHRPHPAGTRPSAGAAGSGAFQPPSPASWVPGTLTPPWTSVTRGCGRCPRQHTAPALIDRLAAPVLGPAFQVRSPDAGLVEKQACHIRATPRGP